MVRNRIAIALSVVAVSCFCAVAASGQNINQYLQNIEGTLSVNSEPYMTNGELTGCQLTFDSLHRDYAYRQGNYIKVSGAVGIMVGQENRLGAIVKVTVHALNETENGPVFEPSPPSRGYLIGSDLKTNVDSLVVSDLSDTPGALFSVYALSPTMEIVLEGLQTGRLTFAFNQNGGPSDIRLPVELNVFKTDEFGNKMRSDETVRAFAKCVLALTQSAGSKG